MPRHLQISYTSPVTSKKGVTGFAVCVNRGLAATPQWFAAFFFAPPVFGGSDGRAQALPVLPPRLPGLRTRPSRLPHFAVGESVLQTAITGGRNV